MVYKRHSPRNKTNSNPFDILPDPCNIQDSFTMEKKPLPVLDPPKDDPISEEELALCDGREGHPTYVAIKGTVFDVSANPAYKKGQGYNVFCGKDASRALGKSSLKAEDAVADYSTLDEGELKVLDDWHKFFSKRYNIVGKVVPSGQGQGSNL